MGKVQAIACCNACYQSIAANSLSKKLATPAFRACSVVSVALNLLIATIVISGLIHCKSLINAFIHKLEASA
ncbi:hypothetical protein UH38_13195 [Aliterella atlantica CENA595]|uniref:Uncharacterized protein n=1 Tax=Aliterella atlantica CENA595 TaxID=1618023 RepID=A0A0D8ZRY1_9CYAN|nr:hypothetical protein UH38_13195 [Aliterella atlantica CENA595]